MVFSLFRKRPAPPRARVPDDTVVYAVGDVHGCATLLRRLHDLILVDAACVRARRRVVVYVGDYVDRGHETRQVIDILLDEPLPGFEAHHLIGNHEEWMLTFLEDTAAGPGWFANGGMATLLSYGVGRSEHATAEERLLAAQRALAEALPSRHLDFYRSLSMTHEEGEYLFVHAGLRPGVPLERQSPQDMLWIREEFLHSEADFGRMVVHGHTIVEEPEITSNRIAIDTGAFATGRLTCLVLEGAERRFLQT